jgi:hypothetical protein
MANRKRPGGNFGNFGSSSFSEIPKVETRKYKVAPVKGEFGGSIPDSLYTSNRESTWTRWRRGWELATANGVERPFFYDFAYEIPLNGVPLIGNRSPLISGAVQGFLTENKEYGMHWAGRINAGNLRFDNLEDQQGVRLAVSGEAPPTQLFLGSGQDNENFWYIQLSGTFSSGTISGVSGPVPPPLFVRLPFGTEIKPINGDILESKIVTVSGQPIDSDTRDPATGKRYGFVQAILADVDQNQGILKVVKLGSVQSTLDGVLQTPSRIPFESGRFLQTGNRYCCTCQDFTRRNYAYLSTLGLRKGRLFPRNKCATVKPGRYEVMTLRGQILNSAQQEITANALDNRLMTIIYPSGESENYPVPGATLSQSGKDINDPKTLYRDRPGVFEDFGGVYERGFGDDPNPSGVAEGLSKYADYKQSGLSITEVSDNWTFVLDQYTFCKHIYAMKYADGEFPNEPSDFPVEVGLMSEWENRLVDKTRNEQTKAFERLAYYGLGYQDTPPFNLQSPMMSPMLQRLINIPQEFIVMQNFFMVDKDGITYNIASGQMPTVDPQPSGFTISNWDFPSGTNY